MKTDKPFVYKRIIAYIIDMLIVSVIASFITMAFPNNLEYKEKLQEANQITTKFKTQEISQEEFQTSYNNISYYLSKNTIDQSIIIVIITLLYFVLFNKFNDGKTIGKYLMKIKIVSSNNKKIGLNNYLIRCLVANSVLSNIISIILLMFLSKDKYLLINDKISLLFSIFYVVCIIFILYRDDGRGLHDIIANTKVVNFSKEEKNILVTKKESKVDE